MIIKLLLEIQSYLRHEPVNNRLGQQGLPFVHAFKGMTTNVTLVLKNMNS